MPEGAVRSALSAPVHAASSSFSYKQLFTFLGEAPATTDADGRVRFDTRVTGGLRAVQFLRIVPLSAGGAEAPFQTCGLVPVAVPMVERPPIPALTAVIDPDTGLTLTVRAQGMRPDLLAASPGAAPEYRLRRTYQAPGDRAYVPVIHDGSLADVDGDGIWTATHTVPVGDLHPFVRTSWLVEVRYPPEPPIPPGPVPLPVDGGVEPVWSTIGSSAEGIWSDPSLVATSLLVPRTPPPAPAAPTVTVQPTGAVSIVVDGLPVAHPAALGPFHLEIYRSTPGSSPLLQVDLPVTGPELTWEDPAPPAGARFDLLVVDPIGRRGPARRV
jgi:hypothetical protein